MLHSPKQRKEEKATRHVSRYLKRGKVFGWLIALQLKVALDYYDCFSSSDQ